MFNCTIFTWVSEKNVNRFVFNLFFVCLIVFLIAIWCFWHIDRDPTRVFMYELHSSMNLFWMTASGFIINLEFMCYKNRFRCIEMHKPVSWLNRLKSCLIYNRLIDWFFFPIFGIDLTWIYTHELSIQKLNLYTFQDFLSKIFDYELDIN